jgi:hypothetical protein
VSKWQLTEQVMEVQHSSEAQHWLSGAMWQSKSTFEWAEPPHHNPLKTRFQSCADRLVAADIEACIPEVAFDRSTKVRWWWLIEREPGGFGVIARMLE